MNVKLSFAKIATGATNFKLITRFESAIDAMPFIAETATKWISVMIVEKLCVQAARHFLVANFAVEDYAKNAPQLVVGTYIVFNRAMC